MDAERGWCFAFFFYIIMLIFFTFSPLFKLTDGFPHILQGPKYCFCLFKRHVSGSGAREEVAVRVSVVHVAMTESVGMVAFICRA